MIVFEPFSKSVLSHCFYSTSSTYDSNLQWSLVINPQQRGYVHNYNNLNNDFMDSHWVVVKYLMNKWAGHNMLMNN